MILGLRPANERRRYKVTPSLIAKAQICNHPWNIYETVAGNDNNECFVTSDMPFRQV